MSPDFVDHPRFGNRPRITGLNPVSDPVGGVFLHWHSPKKCRVPDTAVAADLSRQSPSTVPVTHYFDVIRTCRDCGLRFLFFADEQRHWYEELGFPLESDCVCCVPCRRRQQGLARARERYEELFHVADRTAAENIELADCALTLVEADEFGRRPLDVVRRMLKEIETSKNAFPEEVVTRLRGRLRAIGQ